GGGREELERDDGARPAVQRVDSHARVRRLLRALALERLHALVLAVVVAGGHGHEEPIHAPLALPAQDAQPLEELPKILLDPGTLLHRMEEEIVHASDREAERREP